MKIVSHLVGIFIEYLSINCGCFSLLRAIQKASIETLEKEQLLDVAGAGKQFLGL